MRHGVGVPAVAGDTGELMDESKQVRCFYDTIDAAAIDTMIVDKRPEDATLDCKQWSVVGARI